MSIATFSPYINLYYRGLGYSIGQIGVVTALGPMVSIFAQPLWGLLSDRTNKKRVLVVVILGALAATLLYTFKTTFVYICLMAVLYSACNSSVSPLGDALTLQFIEKRKINFSSIRLVGTISYAIMAALVGRVLTGGIGRIFPINAVMLGTALFMVLWMPVEKKPEPTDYSAASAHPEAQPEERRGGLFTLLKNKMLLCVYLSSFVFGLTLTFYHSFVGIRLTELGADTGQIGIAMLISAASEIPVLIFINKIFGKMKPVTLLMLSGALLGLRMFLLYFSASVWMVYGVQLIHGVSFMVPYYFSVLIINQQAPAHLKSSAQSLYAMFRSGLAAMVGTVGGGYLAEVAGIRNVYLVLAIFVTAACLVLPATLLAARAVKNK